MNATSWEPSHGDIAGRHPLLNKPRARMVAPGPTIALYGHAFGASAETGHAGSRTARAFSRENMRQVFDAVSAS